MTDFLDLVNSMGLTVIHFSGGHLLIEGDVDLSDSDIATLPDNLTIVGSLIARSARVRQIIDSAGAAQYHGQPLPA